MRLGYSYWGFLGDNKIENGQPVSTPDGNATYSWSIIHEALKRGWKVWSMQKDRDIEAWIDLGRDNFQAFSQVKRFNSYAGTHRTFGEEFPELDVLLLEWRFPIPGRNTEADRGTPGYQPDLERQIRLLRHYSEKKTKIIVWDLDHKLTAEHESGWGVCFSAIFETSVSPRKQAIDRIRVEPPICVEDLLQFPTRSHNSFKKLAYIGSRYERDDVITQYIKPASDRWPGQVQFYGNWLKTVDECQKLWPNVSYNDRVTVKDFRGIYQDAVACPLLAKKSYLETGFITPRPWEALMFGTIPVGLSEAKGIDQYTLFSARDGQEMIEIVEELDAMPLVCRDQVRKNLIERLDFMDARHFVDKIEAVANAA